MVDFRDGWSSRISDVLCSIWPRRMAWGPCLSPAQGPLLSQRCRLGPGLPPIPAQRGFRPPSRDASVPGAAGLSLAAPGAPTPAPVPIELTFLVCDRQATQ